MEPVWPVSAGINTPTSPWLIEPLESFSVFSFPFLLLQVRAKVSNAKED